MKCAANGLIVDVREEPGISPAFVLIHGLSSSRHIWDLVIPKLSPQHVLAYDQRGHGESDKPKAGYGFAEVSYDLADLMGNLGLDSAILVGHSWGANAALEFAAKWPQQALGLVMIDGGFFDWQARPGSTWERTSAILRPPEIDGMPVAQFLQQAKAWMPIWDEQIESILLSVFYLQGDGTIRRRFPVEQHMQVVRSLWEQRVSELFPLIACPVLLVPAYREANPQTVEWMQAKRQGIREALTLLPKGTLHELQDTIHDAPLQRPEELAALLKDFAEVVEPPSRSAAEGIGPGRP